MTGGQLEIIRAAFEGEHSRTVVEGYIEGLRQFERACYEDLKKDPRLILDEMIKKQRGKAPNAPITSREAWSIISAHILTRD